MADIARRINPLPTGVDRILRAIHAVGALSHAQICQLDSPGMGDAEVQAPSGTQGSRELLSSGASSWESRPLRALAGGYDRFVCLMGAE
jgi:hypothetical protein